MFNGAQKKKKKTTGKSRFPSSAGRPLPAPVPTAAASIGLDHSFSLQSTCSEPFSFCRLFLPVFVALAPHFTFLISFDLKKKAMEPFVEHWTTKSDQLRDGTPDNRISGSRSKECRQIGTHPPSNSNRNGVLGPFIRRPTNRSGASMSFPMRRETIQPLWAMRSSF